MVYTPETTTLFNTRTGNTIPNTLEAVKRLSVDEQLGLLWVLYENMGRAITPAAPGAARLQFAQGLLEQVKAMPDNEQLKFMRDLVNQTQTPQTRAYGLLSNNTKLAFWYQLAELMRSGDVIPVPRDYQLSEAGITVFGQIAALEFNQQITVLRQIVVNMGYDPLA
jgi:hypothetical protein